MKTPGMIAGLGILVTAAALAGCAGTEAAEPAAVADSLTVTRGALATYMLLTGQLKAEDAVVLVAPNAGIWPLQVRWLADDGVEVAEGDLVAEFDNSQLLSNLDNLLLRALEAEDRLVSERARVASEVAAAEFEVEKKRAEHDKARIDASVPAELLSDREHEKRQLDFERAALQLAGAERKMRTTREAGEADVELQRVALEKARDAMARVEASLEKLTLRAPRDGILILGENRREGRPYRPGDSVYPGRVVAELPDLSTLAVRAQLFDVDDERVHPGQPVRARLDAFPDSELTGRVVTVDEMASAEVSTPLFRVPPVSWMLVRVTVRLAPSGSSLVFS